MVMMGLVYVYVVVCKGNRFFVVFFSLMVLGFVGFGLLFVIYGNFVFWEMFVFYVFGFIGILGLLGVFLDRLILIEVCV